MPIAQPRQRHTVRKGKGGKQFVQNYTPAKDPVNAFKAMVRLAAHQSFKGAPLSGPLRVDSVFVFPRTKGQTWKTKPMPRIRHTKKPDRDNLDKACMDALTGLLWIDDAQACAGELEKWIAAGDEQPHCVITITQLSDTE